MVEMRGLEPLTSCDANAGALPAELHPRKTGQRSAISRKRGKHYTRPKLTTDRSSGWAFLDSNQGPQSYQDCALTN